MASSDKKNKDDIMEIDTTESDTMNIDTMESDTMEIDVVKVAVKTFIYFYIPKYFFVLFTCNQHIKRERKKW